MTAKFTELTQDLMARRGCSWESAWISAKSLYPEEYAALANGGTKATHLDHRQGPINPALSNAWSPERHALALENSANPQRQAAATHLHRLAGERFKEVGGNYADAYEWAKQQHPALANEAGFTAPDALKAATELLAFFRQRNQCTEGQARAWLVERHPEMARLAGITA